jgi:hypothetical protein
MNTKKYHFTLLSIAYLALNFGLGALNASDVINPNANNPSPKGALHCILPPGCNVELLNPIIGQKNGKTGTHFELYLVVTNKIDCTILLNEGRYKVVIQQARDGALPAKLYNKLVGIKEGKTVTIRLHDPYNWEPGEEKQGQKSNTVSSRSNQPSTQSKFAK